MYEIPFEKIKRFVEGTGARRVLVEAPPGLMRYAEEVCRELEVECFASAMPVFGSCLVYEFFPADAVIHLGHNPYPWWRPEKPTLFVEAFSHAEPDLEGIEEELKGKKVVLGAAVQHLKLIGKIKEYLRGKGFEVLTFKSRGLEEGQVLGCDYRNLRRGYDDYLIVAGGRFHALGAALYLQRDVLALDPYTSRRERLDPKRHLMKRMWLAQRAAEAREVALVDGHEGQSREPLLRALKAEAERAGKRVSVYKTLILTKDYLLNLPEEVVVVLSCPRLPLDDFGDVEEKVVLSPGEFRASLRGLKLYAFPF
ncbi:MAG: diphthamide biosynthesis enzyme Dph2 [Crenarchaeota archaeon]|nr:diphthamide biosynthesis enzyme Dph2 [Thermoproteota archaeon]